MATKGSDLSGQDVMYPAAADGDHGSRAMVAVSPTVAPPAAAFGGFAPRGPEILYGNFNQTWLVNCLRRRWLLASLMGLLIAGLVAGLLMWLFPESSRITSYLQIKSEAANPLDEKQRITTPKDFEREAMNHVALMRSPMVIEAALQRQEIAQLDAVQHYGNDAVLWLLDELKVSFPGEGEILEVRYEGDQDPDEMVKIVDAVIDAYKDKVLLQDRLIKAGTRDDLGTVLDQIKVDLRHDMDDYQQKAEVTGATNFAEYELPKLKADITLYQGQLIGLQREKEDIEVLKEMAINSARSPSALEQAVQAEVDKDPTITMYQEQLFDLTQAIQRQMSASRNPNSGSLRTLQGQRAQTEAMMKQYRVTAEKNARDRLAKIPNEALRQAMSEYKIRSESIAARETELKQKLKEGEARIEEMAAGNPELEMLMQNIEGQRELVTNLEQKILEWRALRQAEDKRPDSDFEKVRILQKAMATPQINKYERWSIAGIGGMAALALTCYGVALLEFRRRRLNGPSDIDEGLGVRVLGVLPSTSLKALAGNSLSATQVAEAIDNVRATLMHDSTSRPRQVVMVTSPASMEGSTTVASSLALSLARAGRRTLLIDGDLRAPALHRLFGMAQEDGLSEVLRSEIDLSDAIRPTNSEGLYLLTAGVCDMDSIHALATDQPQAIFEKLRDQFDFIVIDAPPILGISDSLSLGHYVDGAILTVLRDHSEIRKVHHATEILKSLGVRLIGAVVNGMPLKADRRVVRLHQASTQRAPRLPAKVEE